jgi:hypothetical protein
MQNLLESSSDTCDFVMQASHESDACQPNRTHGQKDFYHAEAAYTPRPATFRTMGPRASNVNAMEKFFAHREIGFVLTM